MCVYVEGSSEKEEEEEERKLRVWENIGALKYYSDWKVSLTYVYKSLSSLKHAIAWILNVPQSPICKVFDTILWYTWDLWGPVPGRDIRTPALSISVSRVNSPRPNYLTTNSKETKTDNNSNLQSAGAKINLYLLVDFLRYVAVVPSVTHTKQNQCIMAVRVTAGQTQPLPDKL